MSIRHIGFLGPKVYQGRKLRDDHRFKGHYLRIGGQNLFLKRFYFRASANGKRDREEGERESQADSTLSMEPDSGFNLTILRS